MKRFAKRLINSFCTWVYKIPRCTKIGFLLGCISACIVASIVYSSFDTTPALPINVLLLKQQANHIQKDPDTLLKTNCDISVRNKIITVEFENDECKLINQYDQELNLLSTIIVDKANSEQHATLCSFLVGIIVWSYGSFLFSVLIFVFEKLSCFTGQLFKSDKKQYQKN